MKSRMKLTREKEYKIFCEQVEFVTRSTVLVILYILYQKGWHKDRIEKLYDEIWKISVVGVAKKYGIPYNQCLKQIKNTDIPIPPTGYWTKLSFGKQVEKIPLGGSFDEVVALYSHL